MMRNGRELITGIGTLYKGAGFGNGTLNFPPQLKSGNVDSGDLEFGERKPGICMARRGNYNLRFGQSIRKPLFVDTDRAQNFEEGESRPSL